jgi:hypothetical protein
MSQPEIKMRAAGVWLAIASFLMTGAIIAHGPIDPDLDQQIQHIAQTTPQWIIVHWISAAGLSLFAMTGLIVLSAQSRLTNVWWTITAWAVLTVGALWTMTTAVVEATVVADAALARNTAVYAPWSAFAEGKANGFMFVTLAVAVIAGHEIRTAPKTLPDWSSWVAVAAGTLAFIGWPLGMWFGVAIGGILWVIGSVVASLWTLWLGVRLAQIAN